MPSPPVRFSQLRWLHNTACMIAMLGALVIIGLGLMGFGSSSRLWLIVAGGFVLFATITLMTVTPLLLKMEATFARQLNELRDLRHEVAKQSADLQSIVENTRISDATKALTYRDQELDALRRAIRDDFQQKRWETALGLIDEVERRFGCKEEADTLRRELEDTRREAIQSKLDEAIEMIETHFRAHDWDRAQREIDRLANALPGDTKVLGMLDRLQAHKDQHKRELKIEWEQAARRSDTDRAIELLRELDQYLSPAEVHALQASARHVFKEKLLQLGVQFRFAVTEKRWQDAISIGLELTRDFPNARMAAEVREALDTLRERASQTTEPQTADAANT